jgi:hypothetical protein
MPDDTNVSLNNENVLKNAVNAVRKKSGKILLNDKDVLLLACSEIAKTYTRDEKNYT